MSKLFYNHHITTPLMKGRMINDTQIYYKLDNLQPSGSFKDRGIGFMIDTLIRDGSAKSLVTSSGGNAGHSVAVVGERLSIPVTCFVPITTSQYMIEKIKSRGTRVVVGGANWNEADAKAKELLEDKSVAYIPPFDNPLIWDGNSSIIDELKEDLPNTAIDGIVVSVGGGGLLAGIQRGIERHKWDQTKVFGVETEGAASYALAKREGKVVSLDKIDTIASTLGALAVTSSVLNSKVSCESVVVSDKDAVEACLKFVDEHRILVEPACGASLSLINSPARFAGLKNLVFIVCGGSAVSLQLLDSWKKKFNIQ
jgi:L-serine/L-threonine ammonia-lyase